MADRRREERHKQTFRKARSCLHVACCASASPFFARQQRQKSTRAEEWLAMTPNGKENTASRYGKTAPTAEQEAEALLRQHHAIFERGGEQRKRASSALSQLPVPAIGRGERQGPITSKCEAWQLPPLFTKFL